MFDLNSIPISISNRYMEVGKTGVCADAAECVFAEVWVGSAFAREFLCEECRDIKRRSLESIAKELIKLGGEKGVCPVFLCDDGEGGCDTLDWGSTLYLLLRTLKERGKLSGAVIYTRCSYDKILEDRKNGRFRTASDDRAFDALFGLADLLITEQPNFYGEGKAVVSEFGENIAKVWQEKETVIRVSKMERIFDDVRRNAQNGRAEEKKLCCLTRYYDGGQWRRDFERDEKGLLPKDLKRGVLSEDGVYNLLSSIK